jgi:hypothetical protein
MTILNIISLSLSTRDLIYASLPFSSPIFPHFLFSPLSPLVSLNQTPSTPSTPASTHNVLALSYPKTVNL